ncbi:MAG: N-acetyltransferase [Verrucomicrobiales bacterium]|nr:N-acetyltransferase [Verrucomicrobiales bacterium]|tara:strand:- start:5649 stop:6149 length:501 start_codon:yes stop_codon:yes gene_type:complete
MAENKTPHAELRYIAPDVELGEEVTIRQFTNLYGCRIGDETRVGTFVEIQRGATIGKRCKIGSHSFICEGVHIGDGCFIGHNVSFINDRFPAAVGPDGELLGDGEWEMVETHVEDGAAIGTGAIIMCGVRIGKRATIGAGAVVTKNVKPGTIVAGVPARLIRRKEN